MERVVEASDAGPITSEIVAQIVRETARALLGDQATAAEPPAPAAGPRSDAVALTAVGEVPAAHTGPRSLAISIGYLRRLVFDPKTADGSSPWSEGFAGQGALFFPGRWVGPFVALSLEYASVNATNLPSGRALTPVHETLSNLAACATIGLSSRPARFIEIAAALGAGPTRNHVVGGNNGETEVWRVSARGLLSLSAVGLPGGTWVTGTLTLDRTFGRPYDTPPPGVFLVYQFPEPAQTQPGVMIAVGWRR